MEREAVTAPGVVERAVAFPSGDETLRGVVSLPGQRGEPVRGVVLVHGWGTYRIGPHAMLVKLARELARRGVPALRFDLRGRGESGGEYAACGLDEMIEDAVAASRFLRGETGVAAVGAAGLCSGANVALAAAAADDAFDRVAALSALPYQEHRSTMQEVRRKRSLVASVFLKAFRPSTWWRLVTGRVRVLRVLRNLFGGERSEVRTESGGTRNLKASRRDLMAALARYPGSILFVWGSADAEGMGAKAHFEAFTRANPLDPRFHVVEGSNHNFYSLAWEREVIGLVAEFLAPARRRGEQGCTGCARSCDSC